MKGLFRGFCPKDNGTQTILLNGKEIKGEWVDGNYVHRTQFYGENCPCDDHFILSGGEFHCSYYEDHEIIAETLGEAIRGITDKNGNQIFEGDVVGDEFCAWEVRYDFDVSCICLYFLNIRDRFLSKEIANEVEILGTIYDEKGKSAISNCTINQKMKKLAHQYSKRGWFWEVPK